MKRKRVLFLLIFVFLFTFAVSGMEKEDIKKKIKSSERLLKKKGCKSCDNEEADYRFNGDEVYIFNLAISKKGRGFKKGNKKGGLKRVKKVYKQLYDLKDE